MSEHRPQLLTPYVFLSGGTALRALSQELAATHTPSIHLITTFDAGGSSAALRKAFGMPAIGDLRNRLLALADRLLTPEAVLEICQRRLANDPHMARLELAELYTSLSSHDILPQPFQRIIYACLAEFIERAPGNFDAGNASIGNLVLTGAYLACGRNLQAAINMLASFLNARGRVIPIVDASLNLCAKLANGQTVVGQNRFDKLPAPVEEIFLSVYTQPGSASARCQPAATPQAISSLAEGGLICFPMGSFYSSVLINLLPAGIGRAIANSDAIKVFVPNSGHDRENTCAGIAGQAEKLIFTIKKDAPEAQVGDILDYVLIDSINGRYPGNLAVDRARLESLGIKILDRPVVSPLSPGTHIPDAILRSFQELACRN